MAKKVTIYHLYPNNMNLYGDLGNIIALEKRCQWRGIETEIVNVHVGDNVDFSKADFLFMGGGQDTGQRIVVADLQLKGQAIREQIQGGLPALLICGGFQLFGHYFKTANRTEIKGISVFDAYTVAGNKRLIGNVVTDITHNLAEWKTEYGTDVTEHGITTLTGFENHSGQTHLNPGLLPFGYIIEGYGNDANKQYEGARYKNAYGTYLHGSLLPKNPHLTDHFIMAAIARRYGVKEALSPLDDTIELEAHQASTTRAKTAKTVSL